MKLWIKLSIFIIVIINLVIEIALFVIRPEIKNFSVILLGEKLKSTAAAFAASINGDEYEKLDFTNADVVTLPTFQDIRNRLRIVKANLQLKEDIYTLSLIDSSKAIFGVMTNRKIYSGDTLHLISHTAKAAINEVYDENKCLYTDLYEDQYGTWLTGIAPILNKNNRVVGVVQVDNSISTVQAILSKVNGSILFIRLILIPLTIIISIIIAWLFTKPLQEAVNRINKISSGDYSENKKLKANGELKKIIEAAENLRTTILEQQEKIFQTVTELRDAKDKAEASSRMKSEFLAVISHEIRTPLNIILGNLGVIRYEMDDKMNDAIEDIISSITIGSERLIRTVEMMVLYSELTSGSYNKNNKVIDAHDILCTLAENYRKKMPLENIQLELNCSASTVFIKADQLLFEEAFKQILDNAVKFTERGTVSLNLVNNEDGIRIIVEDTGIGMSKDFMRELFKPFRQEDMSTTRPYDGNGLGLALAKKCCDLNGFELKIESEKNNGTKAEIYIPKEKLFS